MVSSQLKLKLIETFGILKTSTLNIHSYSGSDFDTVFDIISADTFIAGIADKIIEGHTVSQQEKAILNKKLLENKSWITTDGEIKSLEHLPEVLNYAYLLQNIQHLCRRVVAEAG